MLSITWGINKSKNKSLNMQYISYDWVSYTGQYLPHLSDLTDYEIDVQSFGTSIFNKLAYISKNSIKIASFTYEPRPKHINPSLCQIKLENHLLYLYTDIELISFITDLNLQLGVIFSRYTRLDICLDFERFNKYDVDTFIRLYMKQIIRKRGRAQTRLDCSIVGDAMLNPHYIKWGSKNSNVSYKLYNKTKEQKLKPKPYIMEREGTPQNTDFWRLEFTITGEDRLYLYDQKNIHVSDINFILEKENLFKALYNHYFIFVDKYDNKPLNLLNMGLNEVKFAPKRVATPSNRTDKILVRKCYEIHKQLKKQNADKTFTNNIALAQGYLLINGFLEDWAQKKQILITDLHQHGENFT